MDHRQGVVELTSHYLPPLADRIGGHDCREKGQQVDAPNGDHRQGKEQPIPPFSFNYWCRAKAYTNEEQGEDKEQERENETGY